MLVVTNIAHFLFMCAKHGTNLIIGREMIFQIGSVRKYLKILRIEGMRDYGRKSNIKLC